MPRTITIEIDASLRDAWLIHRVLNFKEELQREFLLHGHATIADASAVDHALLPLNITVDSKRFLGNVNSFIAKSSQRHDVGGAIRVLKGG